MNISPEVLIFAGVAFGALCTFLTGRRSASAAEVTALGQRLDAQAKTLDSHDKKLNSWQHFWLKVRQWDIDGRNGPMPELPEELR